MPAIDVDDGLLERHKNWHMFEGEPSRGGRAIPCGAAGSGAEFLRFHELLLRDFRNWWLGGYNDWNIVAPWPEIPPALKGDQSWAGTLPAAEQRVVNNPRSFQTLDALGLFIEWGSNLHGWLHQTAAAVYNEPDIRRFDDAPKSSYFWRLHGLINGWMYRWRAAWGTRPDPCRLYRDRLAGLQNELADLQDQLASAAPQAKPAIISAIGDVQDRIGRARQALADCIATGGQRFTTLDMEAAAPAVRHLAALTMRFTQDHAIAEGVLDALAKQDADEVEALCAHEGALPYFTAARPGEMLIPPPGHVSLVLDGQSISFALQGHEGEVDPVTEVRRLLRARGNAPER